PAAALVGQLDTMSAVTVSSRLTHASRTSQRPSRSPPHGRKSGQLPSGTVGMLEPPPRSESQPPPPEPPFAEPPSPERPEQPTSPTTSKVVRRRIELRYHAARGSNARGFLASARAVVRARSFLLSCVRASAFALCVRVRAARA